MAKHGKLTAEKIEKYLLEIIDNKETQIHIYGPKKYLKKIINRALIQGAKDWQKRKDNKNKQTKI